MQEINYQNIFQSEITVHIIQKQDKHLRNILYTSGKLSISKVHRFENLSEPRNITESNLLYMWPKLKHALYYSVSNFYLYRWR